ncbi:MAG TPA: hypothetical protein H9694_08435 [Firmicutes bacterium]|nr:hypothetical protein [Bacillota bacterium]
MQTPDTQHLQELIDRYVYAVVKSLPRGQRGDISQELHTLIADMLEERCGDLAPSERDVRVVLTELGAPGELAAQYDPLGERCLIPAPYYRAYRFILRLALAAAAGGIAISQLLLGIFEAPALSDALVQWLGMTAAGLCFAFTFVTVLFAFFSRRGIRLEEAGDFLDGLPPVPQKNEAVSKGDAIAGIVFAVLFVVVFLAFPQVFSVVARTGGSPIRVFSTAALEASWPMILGISVLTAAYECFALLEGRCTRRLAAVNSISGLLTAALAGVWLTGGELLSPELIEAVCTGGLGDSALLRAVVLHAQYLLLGLILFAVILDTAVTWGKALRYSRQRL